MDGREFFKPRIWKIILTIILLILFNFITGTPKYFLNSFYDASSTMIGFPFPMFQQIQIEGIPVIISSNFNLFGIILNFIFYYILACLIFIKKSLKVVSRK